MVQVKKNGEILSLNQQENKGTNNNIVMVLWLLNLFLEFGLLKFVDDMGKYIFILSSLFYYLN